MTATLEIDTLMTNTEKVVPPASVATKSKRFSASTFSTKNVVTHSSSRQVLPSAASRRFSLASKFQKHEDDSIIQGSFRNVKDSIAVQKKMRKVNDTEVHATNSSPEGLKETIGDAIGSAIINEGTSVPDSDAAPRKSSVRKHLSFKAAAKAIIFIRRVSSANDDDPINKRKNVGFDSITVRDYEMTLGDQICKKGPPVSLGWTYSEYPPLSVDEYEINHPTRRPVAQLALTPKRRTNYLLEQCDITMAEIIRTQREVMVVRRRRAAEKEAALNPGGAGAVDPSCCTVS
mmetsp:Transcript_642/g.1101  ORF Transcript_642/g.1101 Transcript_642/m.1101 type:complete len:289 (+) Transcript_642:65-931(+)|eukprot:CAMPEP_0201676644 /NCGR_PEP_ID=MMETSP0494-20130426/42273_1 /ASSEMBLY_ACC=CAM_ASM_000839 /TAXON_ID=420259 /ORGANISM="Thalassiosira gravida, Strain GMp14c1" /LENGTH=288 /DNA_ID=CAMNT_0048159409 /DNA_START=31 /DNA_END=897 /DNA_ORIENTATION=+